MIEGRIVAKWKGQVLFYPEIDGHRMSRWPIVIENMVVKEVEDG